MSISTLILFGGVAILFVSWLRYWFSRRRMCSVAALIPGPRPQPFVGNALLFWGTLQDVFNVSVKLREYGPVLRLWFGDRLLVALLNPEDIERVLGNARIRNRDAFVTKAMSLFLGEGLVTSRDETWKNFRRIITPLFHFKILETYIEIFNRKSRELVDSVEEEADGRLFDVYRYLAACTLEGICETALGSSMERRKDMLKEFQDSIEDGLQLISNRFFQPWLLVDWLYPWTSDGKQAALLKERIKAFTGSVITQKLADFDAGIRRPGLVTSTGKTINSFLDMMIESSEKEGKTLTPQDLQDEIMTFVVAGLETTATTMSFMLILLGMHPEVQKEVNNELEEIFGADKMRNATIEDLSKMHAMERVIKETLRQFPIIPFLPRELTEDIVLPSGYTLPKGASAQVFTYNLHRNPKYFPEPDRFMPDRWLPEYLAKVERHAYAYLPFGAGSRNCIGKKFAYIQMKSILSTILRRYRIGTDYKMEDLAHLELGMTIKLGTGKNLVRFYKK